MEIKTECQLTSAVLAGAGLGGLFKATPVVRLLRYHEF